MQTWLESLFELGGGYLSAEVCESEKLCICQCHQFVACCGELCVSRGICPSLPINRSITLVYNSMPSYAFLNAKSSKIGVANDDNGVFILASTPSMLPALGHSSLN